MSTKLNDLLCVMNSDEVTFFKKLGQRVTQLRKEQGLTQAQLAQQLGLKQQVVASYEIGRRRVPVSLLPAMAATLGIPVEELLNVENNNARPGPTPKLQRQVEQIRRLPKAKQRFVSELLDTVLQSKTADAT